MASDLETLEEYLSFDDSPGDCLLLSDLDGFLTGVICCPVPIMPSEWLPVVFGGNLTGVPPAILDLVMQRYNEIVAGLNCKPPSLEPLFWQAPEGYVIAMDWCEGFMDAVALRQAEWDAFMSTKQGKQWMQPIMNLLFNERGVSRAGVSESELDAVLDASAEMIPETVPRIFAHWQARPASARLH